MRQLRSHIDALVATRRYWPLSVQCLWTVLQNERPEQAADQAKTKTGKCILRPIVLIVGDGDRQGFIRIRTV